jgi:tetratricopeptide (TPR) repeat protein
VLAARIDRLPPDAKRLLQTAAVIGTEVPLALLQAIAELPEVALYRGLAHVQAAEFLYETRLFPERVYTFKHALTHEVAYNSLLQERRRGLHARIVGALEALAPDPAADQVERLAHPGSLMIAWHGMGLLALRQGDLRHALPCLERAVRICHEADLPAYVPEIAAALGAAYTLERRVADAVPLLTQAMAQLMTMGMGRASAFCHLSLGEAQMLAGRLDEAHSLAERVLALAQTHQARGNQAYARRLLGEIAARRESPESTPAAAHYQQALALAEALGMRPLQAHCHRGLGTLYATIGQQEQARGALSMAVEMYRGMAMTFWLPEAEAALAQVEGR